MIRRVKKQKTPRPLIKLTLIVIPTIAVVLITLIMLNANGFFMSAEDKLVGTFSRTRKGEFSKEKYTETYTFNDDGTGTKVYLAPEGQVSSTDFSWYVTPKDILVINGHVKYELKANYKDYYTGASKTQKYWYVTKDELYMGENTSLTYEKYKRK